MTQEIVIEFDKSNDQNDLSKVESIISPIFSGKDKKKKQFREKIKILLLDAMKNTGTNSFKRNAFWFFVNKTITSGLKKGEPLIKVEGSLRNFIRKRVDREKDIKSQEFKFAKKRFENIKNYIVGNKILDLGAGNGLLALEIKKGLEKEVLLVDVVDYNYTDLPIIIYNPKDALPIANEEVDTTILYNVLHHANNPEYLLQEATRVTKRRLVIKESYIEEENIMITNSFVDWFYNRVIGDEDINVPLNFLKIKAWKSLLKSYGYTVIETKYVGIDEPAVPEHHVFIIAERSNFVYSNYH
ncbi:MAG: class I SAM-dependent methyltransferase [Promethearchaeota archaeon]